MEIMNLLLQKYIWRLESTIKPLRMRKKKEEAKIEIFQNVVVSRQSSDFYFLKDLKRTCDCGHCFY